jgi:5-methylcytosine-specific restriction endonuclease McrA
MRTSHSLRQKIHQEYGECVYCGSRDKLTIEHIVSKSNRIAYGMTESELKSPENIVVACKSCNTLKGDRSLVDFLSENRDYDQRFQKYLARLSPKLLDYLKTLYFQEELGK